MIRCSLCSGKNTCVPPEGPRQCPTVFIGEGPGADENKKGRPFIGKTGEELTSHYLPLAGLRRDRVLLTNAIKCLPDSYGGKLDAGREKDRELLNCCASHHLYKEMQAASPELIVPMGAFACMALDPDIDLEIKHGFPVETSWGTTFPMYHPAGGIHEPKKMLIIRNDWIRLGLYLKGRLRIPQDEYPNPDYRLADYNQVREDLADSAHLPMACDTENKKGREPYCLTYSVRPGTGRLIMADDVAALAEFQQQIDRWQAPILWHNWLWDYRVARDMGLRFPHNRIVDTMVKVFHLGNLPQGLKPLGWRELGVTMKDFDDVVTPHSTPTVLAYYQLAALQEWGRPEEDLVRDKDGKWKLYKPQGFNALLKRFFTDLAKNPSKDIYGMWDDNWEDKQAMVEAALGPWPGKCISHVPFEEVLSYACRDADVLLRFWPRLQRMISRMRKGPQETWAEWDTAA